MLAPESCLLNRESKVTRNLQSSRVHVFNPEVRNERSQYKTQGVLKSNSTASMPTLCHKCALHPGEFALRAALSGHLDCLKAAYAQDCPSWHYQTTEAACHGGHLHCLKWALEMGAAAGYITADVAHHCHHWECLEYAVRNGCPIHIQHQEIRQFFLRLWVKDIMEAVVKRDAVSKIQQSFRESYYNPDYAICQRRHTRQFLHLSTVST